MKSLRDCRATVSLNLQMDKTLDFTESVGKRVHRYLHYRQPARRETHALISSIMQALPETVVFGGMIRDLALKSAKEFCSDIDMVTMGSRAEILALIRPFEPEINKFGGYRFVVGKQLFDIWSYQDTWAFREGLIKANSFKDLCLTTFFNVDAACQPLASKDVITTFDYMQTLKTRLLDINLEENPAPRKVASRAIRMAVQYNLRISTRLQLYVLKHADKNLWKSGPSRVFLSLAASHIEKCGDANVPFNFSPQGRLF